MAFSLFFSFFAWSWDSSQFGKWSMTHTEEAIKVRRVRRRLKSREEKVE